MSVGSVSMSNAQQVQQKQTGGWGKAVASAFVPGLGQFIDGRNGAGAAYLGGAIGLGATSIALQRSVVKDMFTTTRAGEMIIKSAPKWKTYGLIGLCAAGAALGIANIVDAYKGNKVKS